MPGAATEIGAVSRSYQVITGNAAVAVSCCNLFFTNRQTMPATIVLIIDGLASNLPGPYGNTTVDTPTLNRFAAQSELFDFCFAESPKLEDSYPILWHDLVGEGSMLVADCADVLKLADGFSFDTIIDASSPPKTELATDVAQTQTANFFIHAIEALQDLDSEGLCWLHLSGLAGSWDAPWEMRCAFADEDDPEPPKEIQRPVSTFDPKEVDPDLLLGYQQSAYAQLVVIDQLLGVFLQQLEQNGIAERASFVIASPRGYALGEHGIVGEFENLYSETIHVPLMIRMPQDSSEQAAVFGARHQGMVQFAQLNRMIAGLLDGGFHSVSFCDVAESHVGDLKCLHNGQWKLIHQLESPESAELFAKPDDRWDVNNVSRRCADVVQELLGIDVETENQIENA